MPGIRVATMSAVGTGTRSIPHACERFLIRDASVRSSAHDTAMPGTRRDWHRPCALQSMIEIRRILCPVDFSDYSRHALDHAVAMAKWYDSTITVFNVCPLVPATAYAPGTPMLPVTVPTPDDLAALLAAMKRFAESDAGASVPVEFEIGEGNAATEILERSAALPSDLIVMGTHGHHGFDRLVLGSVTEKVIRKARCPVLTVSPGTLDAVPAPPLFKRILCAIDFSDAALKALDYAMSLAEEADAHLTLAHVVEVTPPPHSQSEASVESRSLGAYVAAAAQDRAERLQRLIPEPARTYCTVDTTLAIGKAYRELLRIASEQRSELIVLGAHGHSIAELLFGSTAHHIVRQAHCPVLTIR
jgi:nucleotide-binding universal stress UspA family protein